MGGRRSMSVPSEWRGLSPIQQRRARSSPSQSVIPRWIILSSRRIQTYSGGVTLLLSIRVRGAHLGQRSRMRQRLTTSWRRFSGLRWRPMNSEYLRPSKRRWRSLTTQIAPGSLARGVFFRHFLGARAQSKRALRRKSFRPSTSHSGPAFLAQPPPCNRHLNFFCVFVCAVSVQRRL